MVSGTDNLDFVRPILRGCRQSIRKLYRLLHVPLIVAIAQNAKDAHRLIFFCQGTYSFREHILSVAPLTEDAF